MSLNSSTAQGADKPVELINRKQVAAMFGVTTRTIDKYMKLGLPTHGKKPQRGEVTFNIAEVFEWGVKEYNRKFLNVDPESEGDAPATVANINYEKARLHKAQADHQEFKNLILVGDYAPTSMLKSALEDVVGQVSSGLAQIPNKLKKKYSFLKASQIDLVTKEIVRIQNGLSRLRINIE